MSTHGDSFKKVIDTYTATVTKLLIVRAVNRAKMTELLRTIDEPIACPECDAPPGTEHAATCVLGKYKG